MQITDPMSSVRHERACPYCHESITERVDADTHILGCNDRWRRQNHIDANPGPGASPAVDRWRLPEPLSAQIEPATSIVRRVIADSGPLSAGFRSLPSYEPAR